MPQEQQAWVPVVMTGEGLVFTGEHSVWPSDLASTQVLQEWQG